MIQVGLAAPGFECLAVVDGHLEQLNWRQVHENKTLVLLFDSLASSTQAPEDLLTLSHAAGQLHAKLALVCSDQTIAVVSWANRVRRAGGPGTRAFPLLVDADEHVAQLYDLLPGEGKLWGRFLIDSHGIVRQMAVSCFPAAVSVEELVRSIQASRFPAAQGLWN